MKTTISLFCFVFLTCVAFAQDPKVSLRFIQGGAAVTPVNGAVDLKKEPFTVEVTLDNIDGVYVYADFTDALYKLDDKAPIPELQDIPYKVMAEEVFNPKKELLMSNDSWLFWGYNKAQPQQSRLDKDIKVVNDHSVTGTKTIQQFTVPSSQKTIKVAEVTQPLYLFFLTTLPFQQRALVKEVSRQKIKINWK